MSIFDFLISAPNNKGGLWLYNLSRSYYLLKFLFGSSDSSAYLLLHEEQGKSGDFWKMLSPKEQYSDEAEVFTVRSYFMMMGQVFIMLAALLIFLIWIFASVLQSNTKAEIFINAELAPAEKSEIKYSLSKQDSLEEMQATLEATPWIRRATIKKHAGVDNPLILIEIEKSMPLGRLDSQRLVFMNDESISVITYEDDNGINSGEQNIPLIKGDFYDEVLNAQPAATEMTMSMSMTMRRAAQILSTANIEVSEYSISPSGVLLIIFENNGVIRLGASDHTGRLSRLQRFLQLYSSDLARIKSIDLRYDNKIAVSYKGDSKA